MGLDSFGRRGREQTGYIVKELVWGRDSRASLKSRILGAFILSVPCQKENLQVVEMVWNLTGGDPVPLRWLCWWYHHQEMLGTNWKPLWWLESTSHLGTRRIYKTPGFHWCFWTVVLEKTLESPLDSKKIKSVNPKGNQSWIFIGRIDDEAETPIFWPPDAKNGLIGKDPDAGKDWRQEEKGTTDDEMVGWHHRFNGHEFEPAPEVGDGQGSLACWGPWSHKESDTTELLNWTDSFFNHRLEDTLGEFMRHQASTDAYTLLIDRSKEAKLSTHRWLIGFMKHNFLIIVNI